MEVKICGFPGYGSAGNDGGIGEKGSNIHYINDNVNDSSLAEYILTESKYKVNDLLYNNNALHIITVKNDNGQALVSKISDNHQFSDFNIKNDKIISSYDIILSDKLKTSEHIRALNTDAYLTLVSDNNFLNANDCAVINLITDSSSSNFNLATNKFLINNLYVKYDNTNILTESYGFTEIRNIIQSLHINNINNDTLISFGYKPKNGQFRITECIYNDLNVLEHEYLIKDFNDVLDNYKIIYSDFTVLYKIYFLSNYNNDNGNIILGSFTLDIKTSKLKDVSLQGDDINNFDLSWVTNSKNILLKDKGNDATSCKVELLFSDDSDLNVYFKSDNITVDDSEKINNKLILTINTDKSQIYKINIGHVVYNISFEKKIVANFDSSVIINIDDDNKYLINSLYKNGVPANGILETYNLDFVDITTQESVNCNIIIELDDKTNIYKTHYVIINDDNVVLSRLENGQIINNNSLNLTYRFNFNKNSKYKLLLYHEYDEAVYGILTTNITFTFDNDIKRISKRTLVIPWTLSSFKPRMLNTPTDYDLRVKNSLSRPDGLYPINMTSLSIKPVSNSYEYKNNTLSKYKYVYSDSNSQTVYAPNAFLMYGYMYEDSNEGIAFNINSEDDKYYGNKRQYSQCDIEYPIWSIVSPSIKIENGKQTYDDYNITPAGGSNYSPNSYDGILIDANFIHKYLNMKQYLSNNEFLGFVGWSLHKTEKDINLSQYVTEKYNFNYISVIEKYPNIKNETMYGSYWEINPKYVVADKSELLFDCAVNILNKPKIYTPNQNIDYWINGNTENIFKRNDYVLQTSMTDNRDVF